MARSQGLDGCSQCMKFLLFLSNLLIMVGGLVVLSVGIWTVSDKTGFEQLLGTDLYMSAAYILIVTGVAVVLISFLGCFGAVKEIRCMLITYFMILLVLFVVLLVGGILGYVFRDRVEDTIKTRMMASLDEFNEKLVIRDAWNAAQQKMKCCGIDSASDWAGHVDPLPPSCCPEGTAEGSCTTSNAFQSGCQLKVKEFAQQHAQVLAGVGIGISCFLLLGMLFSLALFKSLE